MKRITLTLIFLLMGMHALLHAQIPEMPKVVQTPNAAALGLYGEIPVSLFTGTPSIEIPLYEVVDGDISLPLSLSYHASGVRPDQHPGWTGLGWNLNATGVISRIVKDMPDDYNNSMFYDGKNAGFYFNHEVLNTTTWDDRKYLRKVAQNTEFMLKDTEPDEFRFNFPGCNGKFYLDHKGEWKVQCTKPIVVKLDDTFLAPPFSTQYTYFQGDRYAKSFGGFTLITDDGTQYVFGCNTNNIEYSISFSNQFRDEWIATSWYLSKIIYPNDRTVNFEYERGGFINQMFYSVVHNLGSRTISSGGFLKPECDSWSTTSLSASVNGKLVAPVYLNKISFPNTEIDFNRSKSIELRYRNDIYWHFDVNYCPFLRFKDGEDTGYVRNFPDCLENLQWYKLDNLQIKDVPTGKTLRRFTFNYSSSGKQRLTLNSLTEYGGTEKGKEYKFDYNNMDLLPDYLSNKTDHWGFYNNKFADIYNYTAYYSHREPDINTMQYGTISKITYPTGGYTRFVFEPHTYSKQLKQKRWEGYDNFSDKYAGGLRIQKIINSSTGLESDEEIQKEYFYVTNYLNDNQSGTSSGVLGGQIQYYFTDYTVYAFNDKDVRRQMSLFSSQSVLPGCENTPGNHIGYTEVIERVKDSGYTRYLFSNFDNGYLDEAPVASIQQSRTAYEPYCSKAFKRGHLILREDYDEQKRMKKQTRIEYEESNTEYIRTMKARYFNICPETAVSYDEGTTSKIYTGTFRKVFETETVYENSSSGIVTDTWYTYDFNNYIWSIEKSRNGGEPHTVIYKRAMNSSDYLNREVATAMREANVCSPIIVQTEYEGSTFLKETVNNYSQFGERLFCNTSTRIYYGRNKSRTIEMNYNKYGNLIQFKTNAQSNLILWSYNGRYPVAEISNWSETFEQFKTQAAAIGLDVDDLLETNTPDMFKVNRMRYQLPESHVTTYTFHPGVGINKIQGPNNLIINYDYDPLGRLKQSYYHDLDAEEIINEYDYSYKKE